MKLHLSESEELRYEGQEFYDIVHSVWLSHLVGLVKLLSKKNIGHLTLLEITCVCIVSAHFSIQLVKVVTNHLDLSIIMLFFY